MALNQGLSNKVEEQIAFYTNFSKIISDRLDIISKHRLESQYSEVIPELVKL